MGIEVILGVFGELCENYTQFMGLVWNRWFIFGGLRLSWTHPCPGEKTAVTENVNIPPYENIP